MNKELLAATSVFAEMVNNNIDYKDVIDDFILSIFKVEKNYIIDSKEVTNLLCDKYDFDIPDGVIKSHLKRLAKKSILVNKLGKYSLINTEILNEQEKLANLIDTKSSSHTILLNSLFGFIEKNESKILDSKEKEGIEEYFINFLFDKNNDGKYSELVSRYILLNSDNEKFKEELNLIREGATILKGIKYTPEDWTPKSWSRELNLYLDTELLFSLANLNGEVYKKILDDFYNLVRTLNSSSKEKKIKLFYFKEVEEEIRNYFKMAQKVIKGQANTYINSQAMIEITKGVKEISEIISKESQFFEFLRGLGITSFETIQLTDEEFTKYNITSKDLIDKYGYNDIKTEESILEILESFTKLNFLRRGRNGENIENIGHLIVSGKALTKNLSKDNGSKFNGNDFSFATDIYFITEKLWYKSHKGLGFKGKLPITFDAITKAQIIVSRKINMKTREKYEKLKTDVESGAKDENSVKEYYLNLRNYCIKPEELNSENIESKAKFIYDETTPEEFAKEISVIKNENEELKKFKKQIEENEEKARIKRYEEIKSKNEKKILQHFNKIELCKSITKVFFYLALIGLISLTTYFCYQSKENIINTFNTVLGLISFVYFLGFKKLITISEDFFNNKHDFYKSKIEKNTQLPIEIL